MSRRFDQALRTAKEIAPASPLPWRSVKWVKGSEEHLIVDANGANVLYGGPHAPVNADYIVDASNQRLRLVEALRRIEETYTCTCRHGKSCCNTLADVHCPRCIAHAALVDEAAAS